MLLKYTPILISNSFNKEIYKFKYNIEYFTESFKYLNNIYNVRKKIKIKKKKKNFKIEIKNINIYM